MGGVILYAHNIEDEAQLSTFISQIRALNGAPLLCIDEEGGRVARIANNGNFDVEKFESMGAIGATGDAQNAYYCANTIGTYLHRYGFDIDFAPVADVNTNPENIVIGARAFSDDPQVAAPMVRLSFVVFFVAALQFACQSTLQAMNRPVITFWIGLSRTLLLLIPLVWLLPIILPSRTDAGVFLAQPVTDVLVFVFTGIYLFRGLSKME